MSKLVSELGADVFDDTPRKPHKIDPHKRNWIIGLSALLVGIIAIGLVYFFATTDWLSDYANMTYITYGINTDPDTEGIYEGKITASIVKVNYRSNYPSNFLVPKQIKGYPISRIEDEAFAGCTRLKKVTIQDNVTTIGEKAFVNCKELSTIRFSKNLISIGNNAFKGTAYMNSWKNNEYVQANGILLYVNEDRLLKDNGASSLIFVKDATSMYIDDYPSSVALSLKTISKVSGGSEANSNTIIVNWMDGLFQDFKHVKFVETPDYLTKIPSNSFMNCSALEKVVINDNVTSIGNEAFRDCESLTTVAISNNVTSIGSYAFAGDKMLEIDSLHEGLKTIGGGIFQECESITNFTIPSSINVIPEYSFDRTSLSNITFVNNGSSITDIGEYAFNQTLFTSFTFPKNTSTISAGVLRNCDNLEEVFIYDNGPTGLGYAAFANDELFHSLKTLDANGNVLAKCSDDNTVYFPSTIRRTDKGGGHQFENTSIEHVIVNASINSIGSYIFKNCLSLVDVLFENNCTLRTVDEGAFEGCSSLIGVSFPNLVKSIGIGAFKNCSSLVIVKLPDSEEWSAQDYRIITKKGSVLPQYYTTIKENIFEGCTSLTTLVIPSSVTKISNYAFKNCSSLQTLFVPAGVTTISSGAFEGCENLYLAFEASQTTAGFAKDWANGLKGYAFGSHGIFETEDFVYSINTNESTITIVAYKGESIPSTFVIPNTIDGKYVTCIKENFLYGNEEVTNVILPNSVTYVGKGAFEECPNLVYSKEENGFKYLASESNEYAAIMESVTYENEEEAVFILNENVQCAKESAFDNTQITFTLDNDGNYLGSENNEFFALISVSDTARKNQIESLTVNENTEFIAEGSIKSLAKLKSVVVSDNVRAVGKAAFNANARFAVYSKADSKPEGWDYEWNLVDANTYWSTLGPVSLVDYKGFGACLNLDETIRLTSAGTGQKVVDVPSSAKYLKGDTEITQDITVIASGFLKDNSYVISAYIPSNIPTIEKGAFEGCENLVIYCESSAKEAGWDDEWHDEQTPVYWNVTQELNQATINDIVYTVKDGKAVISGHNEGIRSATIPSSVTIGSSNYSVESIGAKAFANASSMSSIYIPSSIISIADNSFEGCNALTVYFEGSMTTGFSDVYSRPVYENVALENIVTVNFIEYLINKNNGEAIATSYAFGLSNAAIPDTISAPNGATYKVTSIGNNAFQNCSGLTRVSFGANITSIGDYAFEECKGLTDYVIIPETVTHVGDWAFALTSKSLKIYVEAAQIPSTWSTEWDVYDYDSESDDDSTITLSTYIGLDIAWEYKNNVPVEIAIDNSDE